MERWSLTSKVVRRSISSPKRSTRTGVGGRGEDVDDPAAHRQLATVLDLVLTPVALPDQLGDEFLGVDALALDQGDRGGGVAPGAEPLEDGPDGATTTSGRVAPSAKRCHSTESLVPMVATSGLTRSKGGSPTAGGHDPLAQPPAVAGSGSFG